jgi:putative CRISPR-associated protein (TIGR02620 family)
MSDTLIVTRHRGLVEWLGRRGITGTVLPQVTPEDIRGKIVYGVLPLHLAALAAEVVTVDLPGIPADKRGADLSPEEMDACGARISRYTVRQTEA